MSNIASQVAAAVAKAGEIDEQYIFDGYTDSRASESKIIRSVVKDGDAWFNTGDLIKKINVKYFFQTEL